MFYLFLKNSQVVPGKAENLDMLLKNMSKWDIKAVLAGCIVVVNWKGIKELHGVRKIVIFFFLKEMLFLYIRQILLDLKTSQFNAKSYCI